MPVARVTAHTEPQVLFATPKVKKAKLSSIKIDNRSPALRIIRIQDFFTPDPSAGAPAPTPQTLEKLQFGVPAGTTLDISENELKDIEILGVCRAVADEIAPLCVIIVGYSYG